MGKIQRLGKGKNMGENFLEHEINLQSLEQIGERAVLKTKQEIDHAVNQGTKDQSGDISAEASLEAERNAEEIAREVAKTAARVATKSASAVAEWGKDLGEKAWEVEH